MGMKKHERAIARLMKRIEAEKELDHNGIDYRFLALAGLEVAELALAATHIVGGRSFSDCFGRPVYSGSLFKSFPFLIGAMFAAGAASCRLCHHQRWDMRLFRSHGQSEAPQASRVHVPVVWRARLGLSGEERT